jgi:transcriptional regulator with XRE-family HTH domain
MPSRARPKPVLRRHYWKEWREFRQLDQEVAAERIGISRTQLSKIENMKSPYSQGLLQAAAYAYQCSEADLLIRNPLNADAPWSLMDAMQRAPESTRAQIRAVVETLLKTGS